MPHRFVAFLIAAFALGFVACTDGSPTDQNINTDAGADYGLHPREVHPDTAAAGSSGGAGGAGGVAGQSAAGTSGAAGVDAGSPDGAVDSVSGG